MGTYISDSLDETAKIAAEWLRSLCARYENTDEALIVGLSGHLGAGKTAFVKAVAKEMGVTEEVTSPTFVIMKIYKTESVRWPRLVHIDAYRLESREELGAIDWEKLVSDRGNLIMIEWPENAGLKDFAELRDLRLEIVDGKHHLNIK